MALYPSRIVGGLKIVASPSGDNGLGDLSVDNNATIHNVITDSITPGIALEIKGPINVDNNVIVVNKSTTSIKDTGIVANRYQIANDTSSGEVVNDTPTETGAIQSATSNTAVLAVSSNGSNSYYNGWWIVIANQARFITAYVASTHTVTIATIWTSTPSASAAYKLYMNSYAGLMYDSTNRVWTAVFTPNSSISTIVERVYANMRVNTSLINSLQFQTTNLVNITANNPTAARTYTIQDAGANDTFAMMAAAQTLTNKILNAAILLAGLTIGNGQVAAPTMAPSYTGNPTGSLTSNVVYKYAYTYIQASGGETNGSTVSSFGPLVATGYSFSLGVGTDPSISGRKLYRSQGGGSILYFLATIDNVVTSYNDIASDASLNTSIVLPTSNTTSLATTFDANGSMTANERIAAISGMLSSGQVTITLTDNQIVLGSGNTTTIRVPAPTASRVYTIPDSGANDSFMMLNPAQTVTGAKTFNANIIVNSSSTNPATVLDQDTSGFQKDGGANSGNVFQQITAGKNGYAASFSINSFSVVPVNITITLVAGAFTSIPGGTWPTAIIALDTTTSYYTGTFGTTDMYMAAGQQYTFFWTISGTATVFFSNTAYSGGLPAHPFLFKTAVYTTSRVGSFDTTGNQLVLNSGNNQLLIRPVNNAVGASLALNANPSTNRIVTIPDTTDTLAVLNTAQTMINKTIVSPSLTLGSGTPITNYVEGTFVTAWYVGVTKIVNSMTLKYNYTNSRAHVTIPGLNTLAIGSLTGFLTSDPLPAVVRPNATFYSTAGPVIVGIVNGAPGRMVIDVAGTSYKIFIEPIAGGQWTSLSSINWDSFEFSHWL